MLESPELEFIMEAHNGLSAKIVQETGTVTIYTSHNDTVHMVMINQLDISSFQKVRHRAARKCPVV